MKLFNLMVLIAFFSFESSVYADYKNPTSHKDCHVTKIPLWHELPKLRKKASACSSDVLRNIPISQWRRTSYKICHSREFVECASLHQKSCDQRKRVHLLSRACYAKVTKLRLRQKEIRKKQKDFEKKQKRLAEERLQAHRSQLRENEEQNIQIRENNKFMERAARETIRGTSDAGKIAQQLQKQPKIAKNLLRGNVKQAVISQLGLSKYYTAYQAINGKLPTLNAHSVSGQLVKYGTRIVDGMHTAAQQDLKDALSNFDNSLGGEVTKKSSSIYNSKNPRPAATQIDEAYALHDNVQTLIKNVISKEKDLPLGTQSIVNIASGVLVYKIMKSRIDGEISSLSDALTNYTKSVADNPLDEPTQQFVSNGSQIDLRKERLSVMQTVEVERKRVAGIQAKERRRVVAREAASRRKSNVNQSRVAKRNKAPSVKNNASHCLSKTTGPLSSRYDYYKMTCSKTISCFDKHGVPAIGGIRNGTTFFIVPNIIVGCNFKNR